MSAAAREPERVELDGSASSSSAGAKRARPAADGAAPRRRGAARKRVKNVGYAPVIEEPVGDERPLSDESGSEQSSTTSASRTPTWLPGSSEALSRDWNAEYQEIVERRDWLAGPELTNLSQEFADTALTYGKIIISEAALAPAHQTVRPSSALGGAAGGAKYVVHGILFKFATDTLVCHDPPTWLYGGAQRDDEAAVKAASHELEARDRWFLRATDESLLRFPLLALITYKGYRLVAMSMLPISKSSLVYGSADGGRRVVSSHAPVAAAVEAAATRLNLCPHVVGRHKVRIAGPGDVEVHAGADGRFYMLDFTRTMPPEAPPRPRERPPDYNPRAIFYRLLRPALVERHYQPLNSDAFSAFNENEPQRSEHRRSVREATEYLYQRVIPAFAADLERRYGNGPIVSDPSIVSSGDQDFALLPADVNAADRQSSSSVSGTVPQPLATHANSAGAGLATSTSAEFLRSLGLQPATVAAAAAASASASAATSASLAPFALAGQRSSSGVPMIPSLSSSLDGSTSAGAMAQSSASDVNNQATNTSDDTFAALSRSAPTSTTTSTSAGNNGNGPPGQPAGDHSTNIHHNTSNDYSEGTLRAAAQAVRAQTSSRPTAFAAARRVANTTSISGGTVSQMASAVESARFGSALRDRRQHNFLHEAATGQLSDMSTVPSDGSTHAIMGLSGRASFGASAYSTATTNVQSRSGRAWLASSLHSDLGSQSVFATLRERLQAISAWRLHKAGINCRHLGRVRSHMHSHSLRRVVLSVIAARCMKQELDQAMRNLMTEEYVRGVPSDEPFKRLACDFFNERFQNTDPEVCSLYWCKYLKQQIKRRFAEALTDEESQPGFDLRRAVSLSTVFVMAVELSSMRLAPGAEHQLLETASGRRHDAFAFRDIDVLEIGSTVKLSVVMLYARAVHMLLEGVRCDDRTQARRLLGVAHTASVHAWRNTVGGEVQRVLLSIIEVELARVEEIALVRAMFSSAMHAFWETASSWPADIVFEAWDVCLHRFLLFVPESEIQSSEAHMLRSHWCDVMTQCRLQQTAQRRQDELFTEANQRASCLSSVLEAIRERMRAATNDTPFAQPDSSARMHRSFADDGDEPHAPPRVGGGAAPQPPHRGGGAVGGAVDNELRRFSIDHSGVQAQEATFASAPGSGPMSGASHIELAEMAQPPQTAVASSEPYRAPAFNPFAQQRADMERRQQHDMTLQQEEADADRRFGKK